MKSPKEKISEFYKTKRRMPSYSELAALLGYKTKSAVHYAVGKLITQGILSKDKKGKLLPKDLGNEIRLLGLVEAGFPSPAEEELVDTMSIDDYLIKNKDASFILRVKGDSMKDAAIVEGDMVIVERGKQPKVGDIVIAEIDDGYTMKYYQMQNGKPYLQPANEKYKPIFPINQLKVDAIVKAVIRKY